MKEKKNIILLIFAVIFFVIALVFFLWSFFGEHNTNIQIGDIISNNSIMKNEDINKNSNVNEASKEIEKGSDNEVDNSGSTEVSNTQDVENISYTDITIYSENNTEISLSQYSGKPVMLLFWNPENEDSVSVLKKVNEMHDKYIDKVEFLMISTSKNIPEDLKNDISIDIYYDLNNEYQTKYNVEVIPTMIYIDKENTVMNAKSGVPSSDAIEANLDILADNF